ncbi:MAG: cytochrome ubiquinol oxidase subunit I [Cumulibacter sp.]
MDATDLARWQFAITTVYHFLFVPVTIGLSAIVAYYHAQWVRKRDEDALRLSKFFGKLFTINFALGLVTGIVQEFQFGMNWSDYSRFVGDVFGAPLALEALLAFFLESTFLGLWIFGWGRIPERLHAACMWIVHIGTLLSAYFILSANSFMQNPVGYRLNEVTGRAEMTDFVAILTNKVQLVTFPHVAFASYMVGGAVVMGVGLWNARRGILDAARVPESAGQESSVDSAAENESLADVPIYRRAARAGALVCLVASVGIIVTGDIQGKIMTEVQPMKMAAAEAHYETSTTAPFSVFSTGDLNGENAVHWIQVHGLLSYLGKGDWNAEIEGIYDLREQYIEQYGGDPDSRTYDSAYTPNVPMSYWSFRLMMGLGFATTAASALVLWVTRKGALPPTGRVIGAIAVLTPFAPIFANSFGWIFTEMGRQPWVVYGVFTTQSGVSPGTTATEVLISMGVYTVLYAVLAAIELKLFRDYVRKGVEPFTEPATPDDADDDAPLAFAY